MTDGCERCPSCGRPVEATGDMQDWPTLLQQLAGALGPERALELADAVGGLHHLHIPHKWNPKHYWARVLTEAEWPAVAALLGGQRVTLPRGGFLRLRKRRIIELYEQGMRMRDIALEARTTERHVRSVLAEFGGDDADPRQAKLF